MTSSPTPPRRHAPWARQFALATELPVILVATVLIGGFFGWLIDRWLSSSPAFTLILGALGTFAGIREVLRRVSKESARAKAKSPPPPEFHEPGDPHNPRP